MTRSLDIEKRKRLFKFKVQLQRFLYEAQGGSLDDNIIEGEEEMLEEEIEGEEEQEVTVIEIPIRQIGALMNNDLYGGRISATERRKRTFERSKEQIEKMLQIEKQDKDFALRRVTSR